MDTKKVDIIIQYALLVAGQEDAPFDRKLGPIHLIKYVYLADIAYAARNNGEIFTGVDWQFHNFGPWAQPVHERVEPALLAIGAEQFKYPSDYDDQDDWTRWSISDEDHKDDRLFDDVSRKVPVAIRLQVRSAVHSYGKDTPSLLEHVYRTKPMLAAAPEEFLDFSTVSQIVQAIEQVPPLKHEGLSHNKKKKLKTGIQVLREKCVLKFKSGLARKKLVNPVPSPHYDAIYEEGLAWLEGLAGPSFPEGQRVARFDDSVWKSSTRSGHDVS